MLVRQTTGDLNLAFLPVHIREPARESSCSGSPYRNVGVAAVASAILHGILGTVVLSAAWSPPTAPPMVVEIVMLDTTDSAPDETNSQGGQGGEGPPSPQVGDDPPPPAEAVPKDEEASPPLPEPVATDVATTEPVPVPPPPPAPAPQRMAKKVPDRASPTKAPPVSVHPRPQKHVAERPEPAVDPPPGAAIEVELPAEAAAGSPYATTPVEVGSGGTNAPSKPAARKPAPSAANLGGYRQGIMRRLAGAKRYPADAVTRREEGRAIVRIVLDRSGAVVRWTLVEGTGSARLDREIAALVERAAPYPPLPAEYENDSIEILAPIQFALR